MTRRDFEIQQVTGERLEAAAASMKLGEDALVEAGLQMVLGLSPGARKVLVGLLGDVSEEELDRLNEVINSAVLNTNFRIKQSRGIARKVAREAEAGPVPPGLR